MSKGKGKAKTRLTEELKGEYMLENYDD